MTTLAILEAAIAWNGARIQACAAPMGDRSVWDRLGAAETALSEAMVAYLQGEPTQWRVDRTPWQVTGVDTQEDGSWTAHADPPKDHP